MGMSSIEYKELLNSFGEDVRDINDDLYQATKPATAAAKRDAIADAARKKLKEYDELLSQLDGAQRANAEKRFGELMDDMRTSLGALEQVH